jgi:hypothetical protein
VRLFVLKQFVVKIMGIPFENHSNFELFCKLFQRFSVLDYEEWKRICLVQYLFKVTGSVFLGECRWKFCSLIMLMKTTLSGQP